MTQSVNEIAWRARKDAAYPKRSDSPCGACAPVAPGKSFALMTTSPISGEPHPVHACNGRGSTSRVISWHKTHEAASRAKGAYRKAHAQARLYVIRSTGAKA